MTGSRRRFLLALELLRVPHVRPDAFLSDRQQLLGVIAVMRDPLMEEIADPELTRHRMRDAFCEIPGLERPHEGDAVIADAHELHPQALAHPLAVLPRTGYLGLVPCARLLLAGENFTDSAGESAFLRLDEVIDDLDGAPLLGVEVPAAVITKCCEI